MSEQKADYVVSAADDLPVETEPNPTVEKAKQLLRSRKFWAAMVGLGLVVLKAYKPDFPLAEDQVTNLVYVLVAYIMGTALEDGLQAGAVKNAGQ